jgi:hypothetical protein
MSRHPESGDGGGESGSAARGAGFAAAKGAGLIGLAVIIGIVLLNVVDDRNDGTVASEQTAATTTSVAASDTTSPPSTEKTTGAVPAKKPAEVAVLVLNGGAAQGSAKKMADDLKLDGYTNTLPPSDWSGKEQSGNLVVCKAGLDKEATALAAAVGDGTPVEAFPDPAPPGSQRADCVVVVGRAR